MGAAATDLGAWLDSISGAAPSAAGPSTFSSNQPAKLPGPARVGCWKRSAGMPVVGWYVRCTLVRGRGGGRCSMLRVGSGDRG